VEITLLRRLPEASAQKRLLGTVADHPEPPVGDGSGGPRRPGRARGRGDSRGSGGSGLHEGMRIHAVQGGPGVHV